MRLVTVEESVPEKSPDDEEKSEDDSDFSLESLSTFTVDFTSSSYEEMSEFLKKLVVRQYALSVIEQIAPFA